MIGASLAVYGVATAITQGVLIRRIIARFGERNTVYFGLLYNAFTLILIAFVTNGWLLLALTPLASLGSVVAPALQAVMSGRADDNQQGELQGVLSSINSIGMIIAPVVMTQMFWLFTSDRTAIFLPGAPFLLAMLMMVVAWMIYSASLRRAVGDAP